MTMEAARQDDAMPPLAVEWARRCVGSFEVIRSCRRGSPRTGVWELKSGTGRYYLKLNRRRVRWGTEVFVYRNWAKAFGDFAPRLQGVLDEDGLNGLLLSSLDGVPLREAGLSGLQEARVYGRAGELCARLGQLETGAWFGIMDEYGRPVSHAEGTPVEPARDAATHYRKAIQDVLRAAEECRQVGAGERRIVERVVDSLGRITFGPPLPTSFDYTPGNWLVDAAGAFRGLIDFENMAWGLAADPFARLLVDYFPRSRQAREAFYAGYGSRPPEEDPRQVRIGCLLYGLGYRTQAAQTRSTSDAQRAQRAFDLCSL